MGETLGSRLKSAWNAFRKEDEYENLYTYQDLGYSSSINPTVPRLSRGGERSIVTSIYNKIAMDVAAFDISHVRVDDNNKFVETIYSGLQSCLTVEANKDQTGRAFIHDVVYSMFDEGHVALVPVDTTISPKISGAYDILSIRTGKILNWYPNFINVEVYNDNIGKKQSLLFEA